MNNEYNVKDSMTSGETETKLHINKLMCELEVLSLLKNKTKTHGVHLK